MKTKFFLIILSGLFFSCSVVIGQTPVVNLHKTVLPIFKAKAKEIGVYNRLNGEVTKKTIKFSAWKDGDDWIKIHEGNDTLFSLQFYENRGNPIAIYSSTNGENLIKCLMSLVEVLPTMIGYDSTLQMVSPFFDKESSQFYFAELKKAEKRIQDMLITGQPHVIDKSVDGRNGSKGDYNYSFTSPGNWIIHTVKDDSNGRIIISIGAPFMHNSNQSSCAEISFHDFSSDTEYKCGLFGCTKRVNDKVENISLKEFKKKYISVF